MRIEQTQLPADKFNLDELVQSPLLLRLLKAHNYREFVRIVNSLAHDERMQIHQQIAKLPPRLEERVRIMLLNQFDDALEHPVEDDREMVQFLRALKRLLETCFDKTFESYDRFLQLAEESPSLEVFCQVVEILVSRLKTYISPEQQSKLNLHHRLATLLKSFTKVTNGMDIEEPYKKRFGDLDQQQQLKLNIFCKMHLYMINSKQYPISEEETNYYFTLLRDKPYFWLLNLLQGLKCEQLGFVCRDILDCKISLTPNFHYQGNTRYIYKDLINSQALQIAVSLQKALLISVAHSPDSILQTQDALYFKFNLLIYRMDELCFGIWDTGEVMPVNEQIQTQFNDMVNFIAHMLKGFHKDFIVLTTDGPKRKSQDEKLALLQINLRSLEDIIQKYNLKDSSKFVVEKNILGMCLTLVESMIKNNQNVKACWEIVERCLNIYKLLLSVSNGNLASIAATDFPELIVSIIDHYPLPNDEALINDIFHFTAVFLDPLVKKSGRTIPNLSNGFTRKMLNAYFQTDHTNTSDSMYGQQNSLQLYLKKQKSPQAQVQFNEFMIERLKVLESPEHSVEKLMEKPRMRQRVVLQINKMLSVLDSAVIKLQPPTSKLLTFRLMQYFILFEDQISYNLLVRIKKKLEFQDADVIYKQALASTLNALEKQPFNKMTIECLLREFGNELNDDWTPVLHIFRNLHMVIFLNIFKKGDYSQASFTSVFKIVRLLCKCKTQIQQRLVKQLQKQGVGKIKQLQMLASVKGLQTTYGLLFSFFKRLKNGLAAMKNQQNKTQQTLNLEEQIHFIVGLKELFPILTQNVSKHEMILYVDSFSDVLYGFGASLDAQQRQLMSLHMVLNLYSTFKQALFRTVNNLNNLIVDKKKIHNSNYFRLKTLDDYIDYFNKNGGQSFDVDIQDKFAQSVNKLLRLFILQPVGINQVFKYRGSDYTQLSAFKMALGMYVDQFDQLVKTANIDNLELYSKCIRYYLQPNFFDNLLFNFQKRQSHFRHGTRATRQAVETLTRRGFAMDIARIALSRIEDPDPDLAMEWIGENTEEIQNLERNAAERQTQHINRRRLRSDPVDAGAIQEVEVENVGQKMLPHLRKLIKQVLFVNLYSPYSELIQSMLIESIEKFEKEDTKLRHYKQLLERIIKDMVEATMKFDGVLRLINQEKINIDMSLLKLVIEKCQTKKEIKEMYLSGECFNQILAIIQFICGCDEMDEGKENILESALSIVSTLMSNKRRVPDQKKIGGQIIQILSKILLVIDTFPRIRTAAKKKVFQNLIVECVHKSANYKNKQISQACLEILLKLIQSENAQTSVYDAIESLLLNQQQLVQNIIESQIKAFFFNRKSTTKIVKIPKQVFLTAMEKYTNDQRFTPICKLLLKKQYDREYGSKKSLNFVYNQEQNKYSQRLKSGKEFIAYSPSFLIAKIIKTVINGVFTQTGFSPVHVKILHQMLNKFPLLVPYTVNHPVDESSETFLNKIIKLAPQFETQLWNLVFFLCLRSPIIVKHDNGFDLYSTFVQSRIILTIKTNLQAPPTTDSPKHTSWLLLLLCNVLQLQQVNDLARAQTSLTDTSSIQSILESRMGQYDKDTVFSAQALALIYKWLTLVRLKSKYKLYQQVKSGSIEEQLIPLALIFSDSSNQRRQLIEELERTGEELENEQDNAHALIMTWERRMNRYTEIFNRRTFDRENLQFLPLDPEELKKNNSEIVVEDQPDPVVTLEKHMFVDVNFDYNLPESTPIEKQQPPKNYMALLQIDHHHQRKISKPITYDCQKNANFRNRLNILCYTLKQKKPSSSSSGPVMQIQAPRQQPRIQSRLIQPMFPASNSHNRTRFVYGNRNSIFEFMPTRIRRQRPRVLISAQSDEEPIAERVRVREGGGEVELIRRLDGRLRRMMMDIDREQERSIIEHMMTHRDIERIQRMAGREPRRELQRFDQQEIERALEEYVEPNPEPKRQEQRQEKVFTEPVATNPLVADSQQPPQPQNQPNVMEVEEDHSPAVLVQRNDSNMVAERPIEQPPASLHRIEQESIPQNQALAQLPPPPIPVAIPPVVIQPAPQFRPILEAMNLPQTFLRDNSLEQDLFDTLPENIQMEILLQTVNQNPPQNVGQRQNNLLGSSEIDQEFLQSLPEADRRQIMNSREPRNLVNEHVALLASIEDPALRQEMLLEATPELLSSLPAEIQAEAELLRQRRLRQLATEYQEEEIMQDTAVRRKQIKKPTVFPDISASMFGDVKEQTIMETLKLLYWCFPKNYGPITVQALLENKQIQPKIITTLIYILRNPLTAKEFPHEITFWNDEKNTDRQLKLPANILRDNVLGVLLDLFSNCPYKDEKLMKEKIPYTGICGISIEPKPQFKQTDSDGYQPYVELLSYALDHSTELSAYFLAGVTDLPEPILRKLVKKLYCSTLDDMFISNLKGLADNQELARIFSEDVSETHHPKISIYAHLLKYKFSITKYLPKLHLKALASYKPEYNEFLNQIYRIYTIEELKNITQLGQYRTIHRNVIKGLLAKKSSKFSDEPISLIMRLPFLMDFETKKDIFQSQISQQTSENRFFGRLEIKVNRKDLFRMSFNQIMARSTSQLKARLNVSFDDEMAYDAGGVTRDWFLAISRQMFNPNYALFETSTSGNTYQPSSKSFINPDHLKYFKFIGRIVGKALTQRQCIDAFFTRSFYKLILGQDLEIADLEEQDFNLHKSLVFYRDSTIMDQLTFSYPRERFGAIEVKDLIPNGRNILVTEQNKLDYIERLSLAKMRDDIQPQIQAFLQGFNELIPQDCIKFFDAKELELLISGLPNIDLDDLKANTQYSGYTTADNVIKWFWEILETYDQQHLAQVIQFITGTSKIPAGGFKALKGMHGPQKISIHRDYDVNHLPQAHTCYNQLELPDYSSKAVLEKKLEVAFKWGNEGFGFM